MPGARSLVVLVLVGAWASALAPAAARDAGALAVELARLRAETETLAAEVDALQEDARARQRALAAQKADLELELGRERLRLKHAEQRRAQLRARVVQVDERRRWLGPAVSRALVRLEEAVRAGLPFQVDERLKDLQALRRQAEEGTLSAPAALARAWGKVEDELRLGRENGLHRQIILLDGREFMADVARVGMALLFFSTRDGRVGRAERRADGWRFRVLPAPEDRRLVRGLVEAFKRRIRTGFFELPVDPGLLDGGRS
jgi:hypothetical protein